MISTTSEYKENEIIDCQVTNWSHWAYCKVCKGHTHKTRAVLVKPKNGGKKCPIKLAKQMKCHRRPECGKFFKI